MTLYTLEYSANTPTTQQVNVPTNTDYKIGVKVACNGEQLDLDPADVTLGGLSADAEKTNGYVTFTKAAGDEASNTQKTLAIVHVPNESKLAFQPSKQSTTYYTSINLSATGFSSFFVEDCLAGVILDKNTQPLSTDVTEFNEPVFWPPVTGAGDVLGAKLRMVFPYADTTGVEYWRMASKTYDAIYDDPDNQALSAIVIGDLPPKGTPLALQQTAPGATTYKPVRKIEVYESAVLAKPLSKPRSTYAIVVFKTVDSKPVDLKFKLNENIYKSQVGSLELAGEPASGTMLIEGTYSDDEPFSINALVK